jgi:hypothetical protein
LPYSCGNALPYFAQRDGLAKVIGTKSGGGDCCLGNFVDVLGFTGGLSFMLKLGTEGTNGFVSDEKAVTLDYDMMPTANDPRRGQRALVLRRRHRIGVHDYESGKSVADYGDASRLDKLPSILEDLLKGLE